MLQTIGSELRDQSSGAADRARELFYGQLLCRYDTSWRPVGAPLVEAATRMHPRAILTFLLGILASGPGAAEDLEVTIRLNDVRFGLFRAVHTSEIGTRIATDHCGKTIVERTEHVPMRRGSMFGFQGRMKADYGRVLQLMVLWDLPSRGISAPSEPLTRDAHVMLVRNGEEFSTCFLLQAARDLVPGTWTLRIVLTGIDDVRLENEQNAQPPYWIALYEKQFLVEEP